MYIVEVLYKTYMLVLYFEAFSVSPLSVNFICDVGVVLLLFIAFVNPVVAPFPCAAASFDCRYPDM